MEDLFQIDEQPVDVPSLPEQPDLIETMTNLFLQSCRLEDSRAAEKTQAQKTTARLLLDMLDVVDALERILQRLQPAQGAAPVDEKIKGNIQSMHRLFLQKLKKHGVVPVDLLGTQLDPYLAEVEDTELRPDLPDETVLEEYIRAYTWNGQSLRQARVIVSKPS